MPKPSPSVKLKLAVAGSLGRMGRAVLAAVAQDPAMRVVAGWERPGNAALGSDLGSAVGLAPLGVALGAGPDFGGADLVVDFTAPEASLATLAAASRVSRPPALVIGTTGFEPAQLAKIKASARTLRIVLASNYSVGMNLMWKALDMVARVTKDDYDVEVIEAHHHHKKDSPSGTAMTTAEVLARALDRDLASWARYGRPRGNIGARDPREIGLHTVRAGDIVGDHTVLFAGGGERLEFKHQAHSRENFARGALRAGRWLAAPGRKPGLYSMAQVLGFEKA
ncbi:MAG TPA: 4-hydroxy-tetrahydrodipicolinate reductase [bacterium]|jgi:4-hydroxy-tetrahydrodipicolinate reductase|nr:4-hydroxy-tetrahydrodipicolinate reductase [bacterium]